MIANALASSHMEYAHCCFCMLKCDQITKIYINETAQ